MYDNLNQATSIFEQRAKQLGCHDYWLYKAKKSQGICWEEFDSRLLAHLDTIINTMSSGERNKLAKRFADIIPSNAQKFEKEYDEQFLDALVEVVGYGWLQDKFSSHRVQFAEPDLVVKYDKGGLVAAMACKRIRTSVANDQFFEYQRESHRVEARPVDTKVLHVSPEENPFLRKLQDTLSKATNQLSKKNAPTKFIFVNFSWDVSAAIHSHKQDIIRLIKKEASDLRKSGITMIAFEDLQANQPFVEGYSR